MISARDLCLKMESYRIKVVKNILDCMEVCLEIAAESGYFACIFSMWEGDDWMVRKYAERLNMDPREFSRVIFQDLWENISAVVFHLKRFGYSVQFNEGSSILDGLEGKIVSMMVSWDGEGIDANGLLGRRSREEMEGIERAKRDYKVVREWLEERKKGR